MKIILVTNTEPRHLFWINSLSNEWDVKGVVFVRPINRKIKPKYNNFLHRCLWLFLHGFSYVFNKIVKNSIFYNFKEIEKNYFPYTFAKTNKHLAEKNIEVFNCNDINSVKTIQWLNNLEPDIVCFLGGDIVKKIFFDSINALVLNYHSGLSPFFNGSATIYQAYINANPSMCGGTLMIMNEKIDGGNILAYHLPSICVSDTPNLIFLKNIRGAAEIYSLFLQYYNEKKTYSSIPQLTSMLYFKSNDWTIYHDLKYISKLKIKQKNLRDNFNIIAYDCEKKDINWLLPELLKKVLT